MSKQTAPNPSPRTMPTPPAGEAATADTLAVIERHIGRFLARDLEGVLADYDERSVFLTPDGALRGPDAIRALFTGLVAEFSKPGARFTLLTRHVEGEIAYVVWTAETADNRYELATDTFVVRDGRIRWQTFAARVLPRG